MQGEIVFSHGLVHAGQPLVAFQHANGKRHVPHAQAWVAKALGVVRWPAQPAAQKPKQLVARIGHRAAVYRAQFAVAWLEVHQVVEAVDQRAHRRFVADPVKQRGGGVHVLARRSV